MKCYYSIYQVILRDWTWRGTIGSFSHLMFLYFLNSDIMDSRFWSSQHYKPWMFHMMMNPRGLASSGESKDMPIWKQNVLYAKCLDWLVDNIYKEKSYHQISLTVFILYSDDCVHLNVLQYILGWMDSFHGHWFVMVVKNGESDIPSLRDLINFGYFGI